MKYEQALRVAKSGNAILFLGSGFSYGLESIVGHTLPTAKKLAEILCDEAGIRKIDDLKKASKRFIENKGAEELVEILRDYFIVNKTSKPHEIISQLPWLRIYTTNYDNCFEIAAANNKIRYQSLDPDTDPKGEISKKNVIHINGYINSLDKNKLGNTFKLTSKSYLTSLFRDSEWCEVFRRDVQVANAIFFIGYSLYDIEIQEILNADENLKNKTFFIDRCDITQEELEDLDISEFGTVCPIGLNKFSQDILEINEKDIFNEELIISNFTKITLANQTLKKPKYDDVFNLLSYGKVDSELLNNDVIGSKKNSYVIEREEEENTLADLKENKNVILYSNLANGKTILSIKLSLLMTQLGYEVFSLNDIYDQNITFYEIEKILKNNDKCMFLIENYTKHLEIISHINLFRKDNTRLLLISRTVDHERNIDEIIYNKKLLEYADTFEVGMDSLTQRDIDSFVNYFDRYGLWSDRSSYSPTEKKTYIVSDAKKELSGILLGVLKSPQVQERMHFLFKEMERSKTIRINILSILCLNISNIKNPTTNLINTLTGDRNINSIEFKLSDSFKNLIYKNDSGYYFPKSSIFSQYVLQEFPNPKILVETLIEICVNIRNASRVNYDIYMQIYKDLASFRNAINIVPAKQKRESLIQFYEGLGEIAIERQNPLFWLQYAIARISFPDEKNLKYAKEHLDVALSLASKKQDFWIDDIKTQYSRYYIEYACILNKKDKDQAFENFEKSCSEILDVLKGQKRRSHALRPIAKYITFYNQFHDVLSSEQRKYLLQISEKIIVDIKKYIPNPRKNDFYYLRALNSVTDLAMAIKKYEHIKENS